VGVRVGAAVLISNSSSKEVDMGVVMILLPWGFDKRDEILPGCWGIDLLSYLAVNEDKQSRPREMVGSNSLRGVEAWDQEILQACSTLMSGAQRLFRLLFMS
jgi:hypothetical protein